MKSWVNTGTFIVTALIAITAITCGGNPVDGWCAIYDRAEKEGYSWEKEYKDFLTEERTAYMKKHPNIEDILYDELALGSPHILRQAVREAREFDRIPAYPGMTIEEGLIASRVLGAAHGTISGGDTQTMEEGLNFLQERWPDQYPISDMYLARTGLIMLQHQYSEERFRNDIYHHEYYSHAEDIYPAPTIIDIGANPMRISFLQRHEVFTSYWLTGEGHPEEIFEDLVRRMCLVRSLD